MKQQVRDKFVDAPILGGTNNTCLQWDQTGSLVRISNRSWSNPSAFHHWACDRSNESCCRPGIEYFEDIDKRLLYDASSISYKVIIWKPGSSSTSRPRWTLWSWGGRGREQPCQFWKEHIQDGLQDYIRLFKIIRLSILKRICPGWITRAIINSTLIGASDHEIWRYLEEELTTTPRLVASFSRSFLKSCKERRSHHSMSVSMEVEIKIDLPGWQNLAAFRQGHKWP